MLPLSKKQIWRPNFLVDSLTLYGGLFKLLVSQHLDENGAECCAETGPHLLLWWWFLFRGYKRLLCVGQYWANEQDVIIITFNHRIGILGFSGAPGLVQNVGLLDNRLALEWLLMNIVSQRGM